MDIMPNVHFAKNEIIFEEGYPADSVYLVCDGEVEVFKKRDNERVSLSVLGESSIFGEMAFISEKPRSATVLSVEDTWCYSLSKESFLQKLENVDPLIVTIFEDLVNTIREKSNAAILIDHGEIEPLDELQIVDDKSSLEKIAPNYSKDYLTSDNNLQEKVNEMDLFMRKLFSSLVNISYK